MSILKQSYEFLQTEILPIVSLKHQKQFRFGFSALTLTPFVSLNSNARTTVKNRNTAESKIKRLVGNIHMLSYFPKFVKNLKIIKAHDRINVDFSTFCGFQVLTFAKQTSLGRAIPVYISAITYPINNPGSQTQFIITEVKQFAKRSGIPIHFVFDRGFELPYLASSLVENHIHFTIRMKKDKHVIYMGKDIPLRNLPWFANDTRVTIYEDKISNTLRIVRSEKKQGMEEPWYLLTNDTQSTREKVIADYYFRFEIEETFKDLKHILKLKKFYTIKKKQTFLILLWFYALNIWMSFLVPVAIENITRRIMTNVNKKLSIPKLFFESLLLEKHLLISRYITNYSYG